MLLLRPLNVRPLPHCLITNDMRSTRRATMCFVGGWLRCLPGGAEDQPRTAYAGQSMGVQQVEEKIWFVNLWTTTLSFFGSPDMSNRGCDEPLRRNDIAHVSVYGRPSIAKRVLPLGTTGRLTTVHPAFGRFDWTCGEWVEPPQNVVARTC